MPHHGLDSGFRLSKTKHLASLASPPQVSFGAPLTWIDHIFVGQVLIANAFSDTAPLFPLSEADPRIA
jgi:hypothetical protein